MAHHHQFGSAMHHSGPATRPVSGLSRRDALLRFGGCGAALLAVGALRPIATAAQETATPVATGVDPLPATAVGPPIPPDKGYLVEEIAGGLHWVTDGVYQGIFLTTGEGVIAVDAPPSIGERYLQAVAEVTDEPITHVVYSHRHRDHIGAANLFPADAVRIAHEATAARLAEVADPARPVPTETFSDVHELTVGNQTLMLEYQGNNHVPGNIFIHAPQQKVLMLVDIVAPGWVPFKRLGLAEDIFGFIRAHEQILAYDFETYVGGHLTRLGTRDDVEIAQRYVEDLLANAGAAFAEVDLVAVGTEVGFENPFLLFDTYLDRITEMTTAATEAAWRGQLGGADIFTWDNSDAIVDYLIVD